MNKNFHKILFLPIIGLFLFTGCNKNANNDSLNGTSGMSSYRRAATRILWGNPQDAQATQEDAHHIAYQEEDFIPLQEEDLKPQFADLAVPQPKVEPGEIGSNMPNIEGFLSPSGELASIFRNIYFNTDEYIVKQQEHLDCIERIANFLKSHPKTYIFVEGHCDERGPEAYNLSLGSKRANYVRSLLVQRGVDPEQIHTISYGKERPVDQAHNANAWSKNRRAQFKIYNNK